jgi:hypothetical protein
MGLLFQQNQFQGFVVLKPGFVNLYERDSKIDEPGLRDCPQTSFLSIFRRF